MNENLKKMNIPFSPPDITESEIKEVIDTLKSGWITTGPKTKELEKGIAAYCETKRAVCLNSATSALEMTLYLLGIGPGQEMKLSFPPIRIPQPVAQFVMSVLL